MSAAPVIIPMPAQRPAYWPTDCMGEWAMCESVRSCLDITVERENGDNVAAQLVDLNALLGTSAAVLSALWYRKEEARLKILMVIERGDVLRVATGSHQGDALVGSSNDASGKTYPGQAHEPHVEPWRSRDPDCSPSSPSRAVSLPRVPATPDRTTSVADAPRHPFERSLCTCSDGRHPSADADRSLPTEEREGI